MTQDHMFNNKGKRGSSTANLAFRELYNIVYDRLDYAGLGNDCDIDALCQNICVEVEKKMGIYPNVERLNPPNN